MKNYFGITLIPMMKSLRVPPWGHAVKPYPHGDNTGGGPDINGAAFKVP